MKKQAQMMGKTESIDFGLSKAYKLLPNFCKKEDEDILSNPPNEDEDGLGSLGETVKNSKP